MPPAKRPHSKRAAKQAKAGRSAPLADALAGASWIEADAALADALVECARARNARAEDERELALELLSQALSRVARRRGFVRIGKPGAAETFDPARHELPTGYKRSPKRVRIVIAGVARGEMILLKAQTAPVRAKRT